MKLSVKTYEQFLKEDKIHNYYGITTYDDFYQHLKYYHRLIYKKDAVTFSGVKFDYNLYNDTDYRQEIFDSREVTVNPRILPLVFPGIPKGVPFPVMYKLTSSNQEIYQSDSLQQDIKVDESFLQDLLHNLKKMDNTDQELESLIQRRVDNSEFELGDFPWVDHRPDSFFTPPANYSGGGGGDDDDL